MSQIINEQIMRRYLLGELSEDDRNKIEEGYFTDKDAFQQLLDMEEALIHQYVRNELSKNERALFERQFLSRPRKRQKVEFAQALMAHLVEKQRQEKSAEVGLGQRIAAILRSVGDFLFPKTPVLKWSFAMAFIFMFFAASWLTLEMRALRTQLSQREQERLASLQREQELRRQVDAQRERTEALTVQLQREQNQRAELQKQLQQPGFPRLDLLAVTFMPGVSRNAPNRNEFKKPKIDRGAQLAKLQLHVESEETYESYRAILETADGDTLLSQFKLQAEQTEASKTVAVLLPTNILSQEDYLITLYGVLPSSEIEYVDSYYFKVLKE